MYDLLRDVEKAGLDGSVIAIQYCKKKRRTTSASSSVEPQNVETVA